MTASGYSVILVNLTPDARLADPALGRRPAVNFSPTELGTLLNTFCELDPLQNVSADPEVHVHHGSERYIVRTGQKRLALYNARDNTQPALVLTTDEIISALNGFPAADRTIAPLSAAPPATMPGAATVAGDSGLPLPIPEPVRRTREFILGGLACLLLAVSVGVNFMQSPGRASDDVVPLPAAERAHAGRIVEGVYVTGSNPGDRGMVVGAAGTIRFFQLNTGAAPSMVHDTWRAGRRDKALCLAVADLGTVVEIVDRDTVLYGGERYRRAALP